MNKTICVFCGGSPNPLIDQKFIKLASDFGKEMALKKYDLVYGGGRSGLMGAVSSAVKQHNGYVTAVFPMLLQNHEPLNSGVDNTIIVESLGQRKDIMLEKSDYFVILPGGFGTLDEFFEVITLRALGIIEKPIIILNYDHFWDDLLRLCHHIVDTHFGKEHSRSSLIEAKSVDEVFDILSTF